MEEVIEAAFRNDGAVAGIVVVTSSHAGEENEPVVVKGAGNVWVLPCVEVSTCWGTGTGGTGQARWAWKEL